MTTPKVDVEPSEMNKRDSLIEAVIFLLRNSGANCDEMIERIKEQYGLDPR